MSRKGIARKRFRMDGGRPYNPFRTLAERNKPQAFAARGRMTERQEENENTIMDSIVNDYMGGRDAAAKQSAAYESVFEDIKAGKTAEPQGSLAAAARERMINRENGGHPDGGRDRANRRAYPAN